MAIIIFVLQKPFMEVFSSEPRSSWMSSKMHYFLLKGLKIPFISNLKKPACASKRNVLELATLPYSNFLTIIMFRECFHKYIMKM